MPDPTARLVTATKALVDAICFDVNGAMEAEPTPVPHAELPGNAGPRSTHDAEA